MNLRTFLVRSTKLRPDWAMVDLTRKVPGREARTRYSKIRGVQGDPRKHRVSRAR
jgi:hypothetical protein